MIDRRRLGAVGVVAVAVLALGLAATSLGGDDDPGPTPASPTAAGGGEPSVTTDPDATGPRRATATDRHVGSAGGSETTDAPAGEGVAFTDVTVATGLATTLSEAYAHAAAWGDVDGDDRVDLVVGTFRVDERRSPNRLFLADAEGFERSPQRSIEQASRTSGAVLVDLDGDDDLDLVEANNTREGSSDPAEGAPSRLLRNLGDGTFEDATAGSGLEAVGRRARSVGVLDHDGDGDLDLIVVADALRRPIGATRLLRNDGDLRFSDATAAAGLPTDLSGLGVAVGDANGDGWPDVVVTGGVAGGGAAPTPFADVRLFVNDRDGTFHDASPAMLAWEPRGAEDWTAGAAWGDLDRDGRLDLVVTHHFDSAASTAIAPRVFLNRGNDPDGDPVLEELDGALTPIASKAPHVEVQDFDDDGWPDVYVSVVLDTPTGHQPLVFRNLGGAEDLSFAAPPTDSVAYYAPGGPTADHDRDGKLDLFLDGFDRFVPPSLWRNTTRTANRSVRVTVSVPGNVAGIGAMVRVHEAGHAGDPDRLLGTAAVSTGNGFSSAQEPVAHLGVGTREEVDVEVVLPVTGRLLRSCGVPAGTALTITEADDARDGGADGC